jgi:hypothetical protein
MAVLAVVLGLFRGPATATTADAAPVRSAGTTVAATPSDGNYGNTGIPGCDRNRDPDGGGPGVPARSRVLPDHVPSLAGWGPAAVTGRGPAHPLVRTAVRGPEPATPGPVELSVLRV